MINKKTILLPQIRDLFDNKLFVTKLLTLSEFIQRDINMYYERMKRKYNDTRHKGKWRKFEKMQKEMLELYGWAKNEEEKLEAKKKDINYKRHGIPNEGKTILFKRPEKE